MRDFFGRFEGSNTWGWLAKAFALGLVCGLSVVPKANAQLFSDDFSRGSDPGPLTPWTAQTGAWTVTQGQMKGGPDELSSYAFAYITNSWTNFSVQARFQFPVGAYGGGLGGRLNPTTGTHYAAWVYPENSVGGSNVLKLIKFRDYTTFGYTNIVLAPMAQVSLASVGTSSHLVQITFRGNLITVYFDGTQMISMSDAEAQPYTSGGVSLDMWTDLASYAMSADDVVVDRLPPIATADTYTVPTSSSLTVNAPGVLANDFTETGTLTAVQVSAPTHGILSFNSDGGFLYTPTNLFVGNDSFTYEANDGQANSTPATVTISVTQNHAPAAVNDSFTVGINSVLHIGDPGILANDTDADGNSLTGVLVNGPANGSLILTNSGGFTYSPATNFSGTDGFTYQSSDGVTNSSPGMVTISVLPLGGLFQDDFTRPAALGGVAPWLVRSGNWSLSNGVLTTGTNSTLSYGSAYITNTWANYSVQASLRFPAGAYGGGLSGYLNPTTGERYSAWIFPEGSAAGSNVLKLIKFQNWTDFAYTNFPASPIQQVSLAAVGTNWHNVKLAFNGNRIAVYFDGVQRISVTDVEAQPYTSGGVGLDMWTDLTGYMMSADDVSVSLLAVGEGYSVDEDTPLNIGAPGVLANDTEVYGTNLVPVVISGPAHGSLILNVDGSFTYSPATNYAGPDSFSYQAVDGSTNLGSATVTLTVNAVNDAPLLPGQSDRTVAELTSLTVTNTATDPDFPANILSYALLNAPSGATISSSGVITWTPTEAQGPSTNALTTVVTDDGGPPLSATNSFTVVVTEVNSAPVLPAQGDQTVAELTTLTVTNAAADADLPANLLSYALVNEPAGAAIDSAGMITWTPTEAEGPGTNVLTTVVTDSGVPPLSATNSFTVVVTEVNSAPVLPTQGDQTVAELTTLTVTNAATDADAPANVLSYVLVSAPVGAVISAAGVITWTPAEAQGPSTNLLTTVVTDNGVLALSATNSFTVVVTEVNSAPVLPAPGDQTVAELTTLTVTNAATDADVPANVLSYVLVNGPAGAVISAPGVITWTPTEAEGPSTNVLTTVVTDNGVPPLSATNSFTVEVTEVNSAPVLPAQGDRTVAELTTLTVTNAATDADEPANVLSYALANAPAGAAIDNAGVITWTPTEAEGPATNLLTTVVTDNGVPPLSATNSFTVEVIEVNSAPLLPAQGDQTVAELTTLIVTNAATDGDVPATVLSYALVNAPAGAAIDSAGLITWTPSETEGPSTNVLTTVVTDNGVPPLSATNSFTVVVTEVNSAPLLPAQGDQTVAELTALIVTNAAIDADVPANLLSYVLVNAPGGAAIDSAGLITWTPSEAEGPSTNVLTTVVTDNGAPPLSATNSFTVVVTEVNSAPLLPAQADQTVLELITLTVTNAATDADVPANLLSYALVNSPAGAAIDSAGVITWTPTEAEGPSTNVLTTVVTDSGVPPLSATNNFTIVVTEINSAPVLPAQGDQTVAELTTLTVTNAATDADVPANVLSYGLVNAPAGAVIGTAGVITWTPTETEGPGTNVLTTVVTDNGVPALSATNSFMVVVTEVNSPPVLPPQGDQTVAELSTLAVTNAATDGDVPANVLSYALVNSPAGAVIDGAGVITWTPTEAEGPSTNVLTTVVTDNGAPPLSATNSFTVVVTEVNSAPVLPTQGDKTMAELSTLVVTNAATDPDVPANVLSYALLNAPEGAAIDSAGVITWTPTEAEGPSTNVLTTVVTDNGVPALSATNSFTVVVTEVNNAPVLPAQGDKTVAELTTLEVSNAATDADVPANVLSYALVNAPAGAAIDSAGVITWTPAEADGPSTNVLTTVVTDNGVPVLSATNSFTVVVTEVNNAPVLPAQADKTVAELSTLTVTNAATDADVPANVLSYVLVSASEGAAIDSAGVITWTPAEAEGPSTNVLTTVVTDNGVPPLSATNTFTVVVTEVNSAPVLPAQGDRTVAELTTLTVTNAATDGDVPADVLSYALVNAPVGASIDSAGVITWTPTEAEGPGTNVLTTVVTDNGVPALSATNSFTVVVTEVNSAPVLPAQGDRTVAELTTLTVTNAATDGDVPADVLSYALVNAPVGASIDSAGVITWTPTEAEGPSTNVLTTVVTDNGVPPLSATNSFTVVVTEGNNAPVLPAQGDKTVAELSTLTVTNAATDADVPANVLSYALVSAPEGAAIDSAGLITWTPTEAEGPSTNVLTTLVTDNGVPPLSATNTFTVVVTEVNNAPVLPAQGDKTVAELSTLTVTNAATDADVPANVLSYALVSAPEGAAIDSAGLITWTPTEAEGPSTNVLTTVVADNGVPPLSATNSFTVVVTEVNSAPVLPAQGDRTVAELTTLTVTNAATDGDVPADVLSYALVNAPVGASIDSAGVITWTPTEAEGPGTNVLTTVVTDNGVPALSATNSFTVVVTEVNSAPVLPAQADKTVAELSALTVTNAATDGDVPADVLSYALVNAPVGASIDSAGVITWTPTEAEGPGTNVLTTVVTDNGVPPLSATNSFTVVVTEVNTPPVLPAQGDLTVAELSTLTVTNAATDADVPANVLIYALLNAPAGAVIDAAGVITWTPTESEGPSTNVLTTVVTDSGVPPLSATNNFAVVVTEVNDAPVLPAQGDKTVAELTTLTVTNAATDADVPANVLNYTLPSAPAGAVISPAGVITWTPTEAEGPSTNVLTTVVTDNGVPALSATNSFTVVVTEVNSAPVLPAQTDRTVAELAALSVTNAATDADVPANALSYALVNAPAGAAIDSAGVITWTPTEAEGPSTNVLMTVVTDNGVPTLSATNSFTVVVIEVNRAPTLPLLARRTIAELTTLSVTNTANDVDLPANHLSYFLLTAPAGAAIDSNGIITWTPSEAQGPATNIIRTAVTDDGVPALSATNSFTVVVTEVNTAPVLPAQTDRTVTELTALAVTNTANDVDLPANTLSYTLVNPPSGVAISSNGVITWTPTTGQGPSTNTITTIVTDNGAPPLSATNTFSVVVTVPEPLFRITSVELTQGIATVTWGAVAGRTYRLQFRDTLNVTNWQDAVPDITATGSTASTTNAAGGSQRRFYRLQVVP